MDEYRKMLDELIRSGSDVIISNSDSEHATSLIAKLFEKAESKVYLLTGSLTPSIYATDEVVNAAARFLLKENSEFSIIVEEEPAANDRQKLFIDEDGFIGSLRARCGEEALSRLKVFEAGPAVRSLPFHYMLVDDNAFRFEPDKKKHEALASFNNVAAASNLKKSFDKISSDLEQILDH